MILLAPKKDDQDIELYINYLAEDLLTNYVLKINNTKYRLTEIEFYFYSSEHEDKYCHLRDIHTKEHNNGDFRFHYSGIDIVLSQQNKYICGILIRGIKTLDEEYINGPLKIMNVLLNNLNNPFSHTSNILNFEKINNLPEINIINLNRYGLNDTFSEFKNKKYRYLLCDELKMHNKKYFKSHIEKFLD